MYIYIYIFIRAACVSECACVFFLTTFGCCCCWWCYYRFLFRTPSRSLSLSCTRSLSIFLTVSLLSLSRVIGVAIGYCVSVSVLRITFFFPPFLFACQSICNMLLNVDRRCCRRCCCWWRCLSYISLLFSLLPLASVASRRRRQRRLHMQMSKNHSYTQMATTNGNNTYGSCPS